MKAMPMRSSPVVILLVLTALTLCLFSACSDSNDVTTGAITGNVTAYEITAQGDIYVVAVKSEKWIHTGEKRAIPSL